MCCLRPGYPAGALSPFGVLAMPQDRWSTREVSRQDHHSEAPVKGVRHEQGRSVLSCAGPENATLSGMELHLTPETAAKLNELARRTRRGADELVQEAVDHLVAYNEWFERKVKDSQAAVARGETVSDEEVRAWLEGRERR